MTSRKINWHWVLAFVSLGVFALALWSLYHTLHNIKFQDIKAAIHQLPTLHLVLALVIVALGYWILTFYDWVALRSLKVTVPFRYVTLTALTAYSVGHNVGLSALSGGSVRYHLYSRVGLTPTQVGSVIVLTSMAFTFGIATMLSIALLLHPQMLSTLTHIPISILQGIGTAILLTIVALAAWSGKQGKSISFRGRQLATPSGDIILMQTLASALDILTVVLALYILMPVSAGLSYPEVLAAFAFSTLIGIISHVPGGLGVFEASMALALPEVPKEALFGTLLVFRILYYFLPFIISVLVLTFNEVNHQAKEVDRWREAFRNALHDYLPAVLATITLILGGLMLFFDATPMDPGRDALLGELIPVPLIETSYLLSSAVGLGLIILARGLYQRLDGAWHLTVVLLIIGIVTTLLKRLDYEVALLMLVVLGLLWLGRNAFNVQSSLSKQAFSPEWVVLIGMILAGFFWLGMVSHRYAELGSDQWWEIAADTGISRFLRISIFIAVLVPTLALYKLLRKHN